MATFWSTTDPTPAARQFSTSVGARLSGIVSSTVRSSVALTISSTLSGVQPNWVKMKAGVLSSLITRVSENTTSAAVSGLPEWKVWSGRMCRMIVWPSSAMSQLSATPPDSSTSPGS